MKHSGSCHCGGIAYDIEGDIDEVYDCNCSLCRRRGGLLWFGPRAAFALKTPEDTAATYTFNKHALQHRFCPTCGIAPYSEGVDPKGNAMIAINVRCLPEVDLSALKITAIDGASF